MVVLGYMAAALIGISLGLIGGGGSILTVPVLVYLFHTDPALATSYSLFIVGATSLAGAYKNWKHRLVDRHTVLLFGTTSITTVLLVRQLLLPSIPQQLATVGNTAITKSMAIMVLFALLMLLASYFMIRQRPTGSAEAKRAPVYMLLLYGLIIGLITGLLGAGGGFLLIPALVMLVKLPMKKAIGTSLAIIAITSLIGFAADLPHHVIHWPFLLSITGMALVGLLLGSLLGKRMEGESLRKAFGVFVLLMGLLILVLQVIPLLQS